MDVFKGMADFAQDQIDIIEFKKLGNELDRDNLADIAWYIKGMIAANNHTFGDEHIQTIEKVMGCIKKLIAHKNDKARTEGSLKS